jgi:hypothetical protein
MAVLAAYMLAADTGQTLADFIDGRFGSRMGTTVKPDPSDVEGFAEFYARHSKGLAIERAAVEALR